MPGNIGVRSRPPVHENVNGTAGEREEQEASSDNEDADHRYEEWENDVKADRGGSLFKVLVCLMCGIIFGFAMEKGRVFEPRLIRRQMIMTKFVMIKMFLSAVASGLFGMSILAMVPSTNRIFLRTCQRYYNDLNEKGVISSVLGGLCLGVGMALSGSCPTSIFTQIGAQVPHIEYTFAGAVAASLFYGICKPVFDIITKPVIRESSNPWTKSPYFVMALPLVAMFAILVCAIEILIPWTNEIKAKNQDADMFERKAWPPYIAGAIIGGLQVPLIVFLGETLGGSSSFLTMVSQIFVGPLKRLSPYLCKYRWGFDSWWQIFYVGGVILGAYLSASASGTLGTAKGAPPMYSFVGGFLIILGARIAGGCTSGHGLSGMGFLSIVSFITVASMFAGGMATGFAMKYFKVLTLK